MEGFKSQYLLSTQLYISQHLKTNNIFIDTIISAAFMSGIGMVLTYMMNKINIKQLTFYKLYDLIYKPNSITFEGTSARNPVQSEKDVSDVSDNGNDLDGNLIDDPVILILGTDSDGDGTPDSTDIDDDGDGILDRDEQCLTFLLDGNSFESYTGAFPPQSPGNRNSPYPNISTAPPFTSVNGDGEVWSSSQGPQGTSFSPQQGFYFIELLTNASSANDGSYWNETSLGSNGNYDRIMVIENVYPNRTSLQ